MSQSFMEALGWVGKSPNLVKSLDRALHYAFQQQHREVTLDHLLLALSEDSDALTVLKASNVNIQQIRNAVSDLVGRNEDRAIPPGPDGPAASSDLKTIFEYASAAADQSSLDTIDGAIVLAALIGEGNSPAARLLETHGLTFEHAINSLQNRSATQDGEPLSESLPELDVSLQSESEPAPAPVKIDPEPAAGPAIPQTQASAAPQEQPQSSRVAPPPPPPPSPPPSVTGAQPPSPAAPNGEMPRAATPEMPRNGPAPNAGALGMPARPRQPQPQMPPPAPPGAPMDRGGLAGRDHVGAAPRQRRKNQYDGAIAPWPDPESATPPPPPPRSHPHPGQQPPVRPQDHGGAAGRQAPMPVNGHYRTSAQATAPASPSQTQAGATVDEGQMIENIPRRMRVGVPEPVEVRIARSNIDVPVANMQGRGAPRGQDIYVTKAMTVRLRAPEGGVRIETSSPETQWIDNALGLIQDDFASWRWTVTPEKRGVTRLQLVVSARTVGADGVAAETALPDQVFDVVIRMNYVRTAIKLGGWAAAMAAGGVIAAFGEDAYRQILALTDLI